MDRDSNSKHWKLGIFYYNPNDPSEVIDKRNGIGTTINFASRRGRQLIAFLFVPPLLIALVFIIARFFSK